MFQVCTDACSTSSSNSNLKRVSTLLSPSFCKFGSTFQKHYPARLARCFVYPATPLLWHVWGALKWFLSSDIRGRVVMVSTRLVVMCVD